MTSPDDKLTITRFDLKEALLKYVYLNTANVFMKALEEHATITPAPREPQVGDVWHDNGVLTKHGMVWLCGRDGAEDFRTHDGSLVDSELLHKCYTFITTTDSLAEFLRICEGKSCTHANVSYEVGSGEPITCDDCGVICEGGAS